MEYIFVTFIKLVQLHQSLNKTQINSINNINISKGEDLEKAPLLSLSCSINKGWTEKCSKLQETRESYLIAIKKMNLKLDNEQEGTE